MDQLPIKFEQKRDFGEIFNATFSFIRQEFKPLGRAILKYAVPLLIVTAILNVFVSIRQQELQNSMVSQNASDPGTILSFMGPIYLNAFLSIIISMCALGVLTCVILGYIRLYILKGKDQFATEELWEEVKQNFFPVIGITLITVFVVLLGFMLCVIPGIILGVSLSLILQVYFFENLPFGSAFNRSFKLTGPRWWQTFGLIIVLYILIYMMMILLSIPSIALGFKSFFWAIKNSNPELIQFSTAFYIVNSLTSIFSYLLMAIMPIGMSFYYFSMVETIERPSLQEKIEQIS